MSPPLTKDCSAAGWTRRLRGQGIRSVIATGVLGGLAFAVLGPTGRESELASALEVPASVVKELTPVEVIQIAPRDLRESLAISGEVKPARQAAVSAQVSGIAGAVRVLPGERVEVGETLLAIDEDDLGQALRTEEATLASQRAQLRAAQSSLVRAMELAVRGAVSQSVLEDAQTAVDALTANVEAAEAGVRLARTSLERATLRAPIAGIIASRNIEPGQLVQVGSPLFEIVDLSTVTVEAMVPLNDTAALYEGQIARLSVPQHPARSFEARVTRSNPRAEAGTRSAVVYLDIDNAQGALRGGMFLTGHIALRSAEDAIALPRGAVAMEGQAASVLMIRDGRMVRRPVTTGREWPSDGLVEITAGLAAGDRVLAMPLRGLYEGDLVRIAGN